MTSSPARRASTFSQSMIVKTYGGSEVIRRNSMACHRSAATRRLRVRVRSPASVARVAGQQGGADGAGPLARARRPTIGTVGPVVGRQRPGSRYAARVGSRSRSPASASPPPITITSGVEEVHEVGEPERDPPGERAQDLERVRVAVAGGVGDVLAPHVLGVAAGQLDERRAPRPASAASRARRPRPLPDA